MLHVALSPEHCWWVPYTEPEGGIATLSSDKLQIAERRCVTGRKYDVGGLNKRLRTAFIP